MSARDDTTRQMRELAKSRHDAMVAGYLTWAADEIDNLRDKVEHLEGELNFALGRAEPARERHSCTPAERALIHAAVTWRRALRDEVAQQPTARYVTLAELHDALFDAVDAVLAERGEA